MLRKITNYTTKKVYNYKILNTPHIFPNKEFKYFTIFLMESSDYSNKITDNITTESFIIKILNLILCYIMIFSLMFETFSNNNKKSIPHIFSNKVFKYFTVC